MQDFAVEVFKVERDLVRLSYWITELQWGHYSAALENEALEAKHAVEKTILKLGSLRSMLRKEVD